MEEQPLEGGNLGGAVRVGNTVRRTAGPWTPSVHALLDHLEHKQFPGAPRARGFDERGREVLTFLDGDTVGSTKPWPAWVHDDSTLDQVGAWMRDYHEAVADFTPPTDAIWRGGVIWEPGLIVGHNDAAPYNAAWGDGRLVGFFDWDFAGPVTQEWDLAYSAFSWVPLHAESVVKEEGFTDLAGRPRRLHCFLESYGWNGSSDKFLAVIRLRVHAHATDLRNLAAAGDPAFVRLVEDGHADRLDGALREIDEIDF